MPDGRHLRKVLRVLRQISRGEKPTPVPAPTPARTPRPTPSDRRRGGYRRLGPRFGWLPGHIQRVPVPKRLPGGRIDPLPRDPIWRMLGGRSPRPAVHIEYGQPQGKAEFVTPDMALRRVEERRRKLKRRARL